MERKNFEIKTVAVFGASSLPRDPVYVEQVQAVARFLAALGKEVFVGTEKGLVKAFCDAFLEAGGQLKVYTAPHNDVGGATPKSVTKIVKKTDDERTIALLKADAWLSLPGGAGSIGETVRGTTWNADRTYRERPLTPHFLLNVKGCYDGLYGSYKHAVDEGMANPQTLALFNLVATAKDFEKAFRAVEARGRSVLPPVSGGCSTAQPVSSDQNQGQHLN